MSVYYIPLRWSGDVYSPGGYKHIAPLEQRGFLFCVVLGLLTDIVNRFLILNSSMKKCPNFSNFIIHYIMPNFTQQITSKLELQTVTTLKLYCLHRVHFQFQQYHRVPQQSVSHSLTQGQSLLSFV